MRPRVHVECTPIAHLLQNRIANYGWNTAQSYRIFFPLKSFRSTSPVTVISPTRRTRAYNLQFTHRWHDSAYGAHVRKNNTTSNMEGMCLSTYNSPNGDPAPTMEHTCAIPTCFYKHEPTLPRRPAPTMEHNLYIVNLIETKQRHVLPSLILWDS